MSPFYNLIRVSCIFYEQGNAVTHEKSQGIEDKIIHVVAPDKNSEDSHDGNQKTIGNADPSYTIASGWNTLSNSSPVR